MVEIAPGGVSGVLAFVALVATAIAIVVSWSARRRIRRDSAVEVMDVGLLVCDGKGRIVDANRHAASLTGRVPDDLRGTGLDTLFVRSDAIRERLEAREAIHGIDHVLSRGDDDHVEVTLSLVFIRSGGCVATIADVRKRKKAEREILDAVTLLESTLDATADGILVVAGSGRILSYNQRFMEMWAVPQDVLESGDDRRAFAIALSQVVDAEQFRRTIDSVYRNGEAETFEIIELKDGRRFERSSIGRIVDGSSIRVWSFRDVTTRVAAENALRESEIRYRLLFEQNAAGVCVMRFDGTIVDCNAHFAALLGYRRSEIIGGNVGRHFARPVEREELTKMLLDSSRLVSVEIELRRANGSSAWVLQNLSLVGEGPTAAVHMTVVDISDRKRAEEQIEFHAYHDVLTRLPNRRLFTDRLQQAITRARRYGRSLAILFIDLDHFKEVNDSLGHTAGDELLLDVAARLRGCVREDDTVARLGGDEFTIIISELREPDDAVTVARKIQEAVQAPFSIGGTLVQVTASIGIATYPINGSDPESLLRNADTAMYRAKESGRNTWKICAEDMRLRAVERVAVESRLRNALGSGQLALQYQPIVNVATGRLAAAEAVLQWNDPERGLVEASDFLHIAEESRLIIPIGEWMMEEIAVQARLWRRVQEHLRVSFNVSPRQFLQSDLAASLRRAIERARVDPQAIDIELSETAAMYNADITAETIARLRDLGVGVVIDGFGIGASGLAAIKRLPITALKIDRVFVRGASSDSRDVAAIRAAVALARSFGLRSMADGVETGEQFAVLQRQHCIEAQGQHFARTLAADAFGQLLATGEPLGVTPPRLHL